MTKPFPAPLPPHDPACPPADIYLAVESQQTSGYLHTFGCDLRIPPVYSGNAPKEAVVKCRDRGFHKVGKG